LLAVKISPEMTYTLGIVLAVEQGIHELRKLGIEQLLWELSRHEANLAKDSPSDVEDLT
jgi:hypothetical protein